ncbi:MAG: biopolymer transporter ExbD [Rhodocyclaceae bacterium]|nr:biopolymer transporter ExbD [Rhodocyclaceae bacterium]MBX3666950.1 biopolymer transporter ExbD [Rhodocyclaceae bacterium]
MNFRRGTARDEPEINLIPMIDVLLVILIFLMITTTYSKYGGLEINLPSADASANPNLPNEVNVMISNNGDIVINRVPVGSREIDAIGAALRRAAGDMKNPVVIIGSDKDARLQSSIDVMQAAQQVGLGAITFQTQSKR